MFSVYYMIHGRGVKVYIKTCMMVDKACVMVD